MPATGKDILNIIREQLDLSDYRKVHWEGTLRGIPGHRPRTSRGHAHRLPAPVRHDPVARRRGALREQGEDQSATNSSPSSRAKHGDAIYGLDRILMQLVNAFKSAAHGLRHRTPRAACCTARSARRRAPSPACSSAASKSTRAPTTACSSPSPGRAPNGTWLKDPMHGEPLQLVPLDMRAAVLAQAQRRPQARSRATRSRSRANCAPF